MRVQALAEGVVLRVLPLKTSNAGSLSDAAIVEGILLEVAVDDPPSRLIKKSSELRCHAKLRVEAVHVFLLSS